MEKLKQKALQAGLAKSSHQVAGQAPQVAVAAKVIHMACRFRNCIIIILYCIYLFIKKIQHILITCDHGGIELHIC